MSAGAPRTRHRRVRPAVHGAALVAGAAAVTALGLVAAGLVTGELPGDRSWPVSAVLAGVVVGGLCWGPARRWASAVAVWLTAGQRRSPEDVVRSFGRRVGRETTDEELLEQLAEALVRVLGAASAEVWRDPGNGLLERVVSVPTGPPLTVQLDEAARRALASTGVVGRAWLESWQPELLHRDAPGDVRVAPASHAGVLHGLVMVTRLAGAERFDAEDDAVLVDLGTRLGVVLHNRVLDATLQETLADLRATNAELRASRVRLVTTADAERRRLERNLHDGAQQHLVALAVNLRLAADEIAADPAAVKPVLAALGDDVREAINELRTLAHGIYPPVLMDAGIVEALRASARRSPSSVTVVAGQVGRYPTEVEAAAYFCCMEALQNAVKHAPDAAVRIHLDERDGVLELVVEDDGPGVEPAQVRPGHGLGNMVDRLGAIGGTIEVGRSASGGTRIHGRIGVGAGRPAMDGR